MENQQEGKAEKGFKNFGKKVDDFVVELGEAGEKLQKEFNAKYEELKVATEKLKDDEQNRERWREVENSLKKAGDELSHAFKAAFSKKKPPENNSTEA